MATRNPGPVDVVIARLAMPVSATWHRDRKKRAVVLETVRPTGMWEVSQFIGSECDLGHPESRPEKDTGHRVFYQQDTGLPLTRE